MDASQISFEEQKAIAELMIDSAKTYMQLGSAALALSITFVEKLLGERALRRRDPLLSVSWIMFLIAIGAASLYQYVETVFLDSITTWPGTGGWMPDWLRHNPGWVFGAMQIAFYAGAVLFTISAMRRLNRPK